jgi:hypothetical protein
VGHLLSSITTRPLYLGFHIRSQKHKHENLINCPREKAVACVPVVDLATSANDGKGGHESMDIGHCLVDLDAAFSLRP